MQNVAAEQFGCITSAQKYRIKSIRMIMRWKRSWAFIIYAGRIFVSMERQLMDSTVVSVNALYLDVFVMKDADQIRKIPQPKQLEFSEYDTIWRDLSKILRECWHPREHSYNMFE